MERHVRLVAQDLAVVARADREQVARTHLVAASVVHRHEVPAGDDQADVLDRAARLAESGPNVLGPAPARLVRRPADRQLADPHDREPPERERPLLVG
jgi:hypothetical protein